MQYTETAATTSHTALMCSPRLKAKVAKAITPTSTTRPHIRNDFNAFMISPLKG